MNYEGTVHLHAAAPDVWDFVLDVDKFASCMPGVEGLKRIDDETFEGVMRARVGPISSEFAFQARIVDSTPPSRLTSRVEGQDSLTKSTMTSEITMDLDAAGPGETALVYRATVDVKGRLAIIGDMVLRATGGQVIEEFFKRLRARVEDPAQEAGGNG